MNNLLFAIEQPVYPGTFGHRKYLAVPQYPQWASIDDFKIFSSGKKTIPEKEAPNSLAKLCIKDNRLLIQIHATEPLKVNDNNKPDCPQLWSGDLFEIFFGNTTPSPWCAQFVVGAGGGRFSDFLTLDQWTGNATIVDGGYCLDIAIPLSALPISGNSIGFNLCRQRKAAIEYNVWSPVFYGFHEPENFGELLLDTYSNVFEQRFHQKSEAITSRAAFEEAVASRCISPLTLQSGPRLLHPSQTGMSILWESAGACYGQVHYRKKGELEFKQATANVINGQPQVTRLHVRHLTDLLPATEYEYKVLNLHVVDHSTKESPLFQFRTLPSKPEDFQALLICDPHADHTDLNALLTSSDFKHIDWLINLGDMHSGWNGVETIQRGFLQVETQFCQGRIPISMLRGNHECRGNSTTLFDTWLGTADGRPYRLLRHGDIAFVMLDTADPQFNILGCNQEFLDEEKNGCSRPCFLPNTKTPPSASSSAIFHQARNLPLTAFSRIASLPPMSPSRI